MAKRRETSGFVLLFVVAMKLDDIVLYCDIGKARNPLKIEVGFGNAFTTNSVTAYSYSDKNNSGVK